jgi:hypothetical protein
MARGLFKTQESSYVVTPLPHHEKLALFASYLSTFIG